MADGVLLDVMPLWGIRDPFSTMTHLAGWLLAAAGTAVLLRRGRRRGLSGLRLASLAAYGVSLVLVFAASTLFHAPSWPHEDLVLFMRLDHAAIFLLIGGTCTVVYSALDVPWAPALIAGTWLLALAALALKMVVWPMGLWRSAAVYLILGWVGAAGLFACAGVVGWRRLRLVLWGAAAYSAGAVVFASGWPVLWPGVVEGHELFHVLVLAGAAFHYAYVYRHCTTAASRRAEAPGLRRPAASARAEPLPVEAAG